MNAKIGEGSPIGRHALGTMNDNGARLVNFARANAFVAANCLMRRHPRRLYTWKSFDLTCSNQIDYFLVKGDGSRPSANARQFRKQSAIQTNLYLR